MAAEEAENPRSTRLPGATRVVRWYAFVLHRQRKRCLTSKPESRSDWRVRSSIRLPHSMSKPGCIRPRKITPSFGEAGFGGGTVETGLVSASVRLFRSGSDAVVMIRKGYARLMGGPVICPAGSYTPTASGNQSSCSCAGGTESPVNPFFDGVEVS